MSLRHTGVLLRNYAVYLQHAFWAASARGRFPLNPTSDFVISVASYPARIHLVPAVFESLARQTVNPRHAYLVLSEEDYPDERVPKGIEKLVERGVEIVWTRNNPYAVKVITPILARNSACAICTFDDDQIYGQTVLAELVSRGRKEPRTIVGFWGKALYRRGQVLRMMYREAEKADECTPSNRLYLIKGSGVFYSPDSLDQRVTELDAIHRIVPGRGADIWLWAAALAGDAKQVCISSKANSRMWIPIPQTGKTLPRDRPGGEVLEQRFQMAIDFFGIRDKLLRELPDHG